MWESYQIIHSNKNNNKSLYFSLKCTKPHANYSNIFFFPSFSKLYWLTFSLSPFLFFFQPLFSPPINFYFLVPFFCEVIQLFISNPKIYTVSFTRDKKLLLPLRNIMCVHIYKMYIYMHKHIHILYVHIYMHIHIHKHIQLHFRM